MSFSSAFNKALKDRGYTVPGESEQKNGAAVQITPTPRQPLYEPTPVLTRYNPLMELAMEAAAPRRDNHDVLHGIAPATEANPNPATDAYSARRLAEMYTPDPNESAWETGWNYVGQNQQKTGEALRNTRLANTFGGAVNTSGAGYVNAGGTLLDFAHRNAAYNVNPDEWATYYEEARSAPELPVVTDLYGKADRLQERGTQQIEEAKDGLGWLGQRLVDAGVSGTQMLGDAVVNAIVPGAGLTALGTRAFGSAAMDARHEGAGINQQMLYGLTNAAVEVLSEKIGDIPGIYGGGWLDDAAKSVVSRWTSNPVLYRAAMAGASALGESLEEFAAGIIEPGLKSIYNGKSIPQNYTADDWREMGEAMFVGAMLGGLGGMSPSVQAPRPAPVGTETAAAVKTADEAAGVAPETTPTVQPAAQPVVQPVEIPEITREMVRAVAADPARLAELGISTKGKDGSQIRGEVRLALEAQRDAQVKAAQTAAKAQENLNKHTELGWYGMPDMTPLAPNNWYAQQNEAPAAEASAAVVQDAPWYSTPPSDNYGGNTWYQAVQMAEEQTKRAETANADIVNQYVDSQVESGAFSQRMSDTAKRMYIPSQDATGYVQGMTAAYNAGRDGKPMNAVNAPALNGMQLQAAYIEGQAAGSQAQRSTTASQQAQAVLWDASRTASQAETSVKAPGLVIDEYSKKAKLTSTAARVLDAFGKTLGVEIRFVDSITDDDGKRNGGQGKYKDGVIQIAVGAKDPYLTVAVHESVHRIRALSPEAYDSLKSFVQKNIGDKRMQTSELIRSLGYEEGTDLTEEVVCDAFGVMLGDESILNEYVQDNRTAAQKLLDAFHDILVKVQRALAGQSTRLSPEQRAEFKGLEKKLDAMSERLGDALKAAQEAYETNGGKPAPKSIEPDFAEAKYSIAPPYRPNTEALARFEKALDDDAGETYALFSDINKIGGDIAKRYMLPSKWNEQCASDPAFAETARNIAERLPEKLLKNAHINPDGTITETAFEKEFRMERSMVQRLVDSLPMETIPSDVESNGRRIRISKKDKVNTVGGEAYRRALLDERRKMYREGRLPTKSIGGLGKDTWGAMGFLATNGKTGASGDFTTLCPQMYYNKGCFYCYRRAALTTGVNNKLVGENVWYTGEVLQLKQEDIDNLNKNGGLRIQSFGDWMEQYSSQLADLLMDAEEVGLQIKIITKEPSMIDTVALLRDQGIGKNLYFNLSADYTIEEQGAINNQTGDGAQPRNPFRPYMKQEDGRTFWKRALTVEEANEYRKQYPWVNTRIVATTVDEFLEGLRSPMVDVVTGYHGNIRQFERVSSATGETLLQVEALGDAGMPRFAFNQKTGKWTLEYEGKTATHKKLAKAIEDAGLQMQYYIKSCCITGRCATCEGKCGKVARDFNVKNATNADKQSVAYWQKHMTSVEDNPLLLDQMEDTQAEALLDAELSRDGTRYALVPYSEKQKSNWANSKRIVIYESDAQVKQFVADALAGKNLGQKIYFGAIPGDLAAKIYKETGIDVSGYNCSISAYEIQKIFSDHGTEKTEAPRGQRPITDDDIAAIPLVIQAPDEIRPSNRTYHGKPAIEFVKTLNGRTTIVTYTSTKSHDLVVQTMYSGKNKGNLATPTGEQAPVNTPEANGGTVPGNNIASEGEKSKPKKLGSPEALRQEAAAKAEGIGDGTVFNRTVVLKEETVDKYLKDYATKFTPKYAQAYIAYMSPREFLNLTTTKPGLDRIARETGSLDLEELKDATVHQPIQLTINHGDGAVIGHEGRHRALAMMRAGVEKMPVLIFDSANKYDKKAIKSLSLGGQFDETVSEMVKDVVPLSYERRDSVIQKFATQPANERIAENYGRETVRYSTSTKDLLKQYAEQYGEMDKGENPAHDVTVPKRTTPKTKVGQTIRTIAEAGVTPEAVVPTIEEMVANHEFDYTPYSDEAAIKNAEGYIAKKGWSKALTDWTSEVERGGVSKTNTVIGWALYNNAVSSEDMETAVLIMRKMAQHQRNAGQAVQATRILKKLDPQTQLYNAEMTVQDINDDLKKRLGNDAPEVEIDEDLAEIFLHAKTQQERDRIMKKIYQNIGKQMPSTFMDRWTAFRYTAMLGNPRTIIRNVAGNAGFAPIVAAKDLTATAIEGILSAATGGKYERTKGNIIGRGDLLKAAWNDYANVQEQAMGQSKYSDRQMANKEIQDSRKVFGNTRSKAWNKTGGTVLEGWRKATNVAMDTTDVWFNKPQYVLAMAQYCAANGISAEQIRSGKGLDKARAYAINEAQKATYRDTNDFSQMVSSLGKGWLNSENKWKRGIATLGEGILPFRKTPANILARGIEYSPIGMLKSLTYDLAQVKKGNMAASEMVDNLSAGLTGTGLLALGAYLAAQGLLKGRGGSDDKKKKFKDLEGHQDYAIEFPDGTSITLDWLAPEALPMFIGANLYETAKEERENIQLKDVLSAIGNVTEPMLSMSMLSSLNELLNGTSYSKDGEINALTSKLSSAATSYLTQAFPTLLGQIERTGEGKRMTTYTDKNSFLTGDMQYTLGKISAKVPFFDYHQIPYIDAWGREELTGRFIARAANNFVNPSYISKVNESGMEKELERLYDSTGENVFPQRADKYFNVDGERKDLTAEEYLTYATEKGRASYAIVGGMTESDLYKGMSDAEKASCVKDAYTYANETARTAVGGKITDSWVEKALTGVNRGIAPETYIMLRNMTNDIEGIKGSDGKTIANSKGLQIMETVYSIPGLNDEQRRYLNESFGVGSTVIGYNKTLVAEKLSAMRNGEEKTTSKTSTAKTTTPKAETPKTAAPKTDTADVTGSTVISKATYDPSTETASVTYKSNGKTYTYDGITQEDWDAFKASDSKGAYIRNWK